MRIAFGARPAQGRRLSAAAAEFADYEKAGVELFTVAELYGFDAVSLASATSPRAPRGRTSRPASCRQLYSRTPTLLAMTAAGFLDDVSDGRFELGIGTSGPQVIEGFHGVPFDAPIGRTRETIEICRPGLGAASSRWSYHGKYYDRAASARRGHRPRQAAQDDRPPVPRPHPDHGRRDRAAERHADRRACRGLGAAVLRGGKGRGRVGRVAAHRLRQARQAYSSGPLDVQCVGASVAIGDGRRSPARRTRPRPQRALYIGGMGARGRNFYNDLVYQSRVLRTPRRGSRTLPGREEAGEPRRRCLTTCSPRTSLIGPEGYVLGPAERARRVRCHDPWPSARWQQDHASRLRPDRARSAG